MLKLWLSGKVHEDSAKILAWSRKHFGSDAADRYRELIRQGIDDLQDDPERFGTRRTTFLNGKYALYHLSNANERAITSTGIVQSPRHFIVFRYDATTLRVYRILHDRMDLQRHLR